MTFAGETNDGDILGILIGKIVASNDELAHQRGSKKRPTSSGLLKARFMLRPAKRLLLTSEEGGQRRPSRICANTKEAEEQTLIGRDCRMVIALPKQNPRIGRGGNSFTLPGDIGLAALVTIATALWAFGKWKTMTTDISSYGVIELTRAEASKTCGGIAPLVVAAAAGFLGGAVACAAITGISYAINWLFRH
ncbi:hypothetical protein ACOJBO_04215 [Rhizobium beringeri]